MNIYEALQKDHRKVEKLLDQLLEASKEGEDRWKGLLDKIRGEVIPHSRAEEAVFYNALRELGQEKGILVDSYREHAMAEAELRTLGAMKLVGANWTAAVEKLKHDLLHHIEEEESRVFADARKVFSDEEAKQIGAAFLRLKPEMKRDADSMLASTVDLIANLLPRRLVTSFKKGLEKARSRAAA